MLTDTQKDSVLFKLAAQFFKRVYFLQTTIVPKSLFLLGLSLSCLSQARGATMADLCSSGLAEGTYKATDLAGGNFLLNLFCSQSDHLEASFTGDKFLTHYELPYSEIVTNNGVDNLVLASFGPDPGDASSIGSTNIGMVMVLQVSSLLQGKIVGHYRALTLSGPLQFNGLLKQRYVQYTPPPGDAVNFDDKFFDGVFAGVLPSGVSAHLDLFVLGGIERAILHTDKPSTSAAYYDGIAVPSRGEIRVSSSVGKGETGEGSIGQLRGHFIDQNTIELYAILPDLSVKTPVVFKRVVSKH